VCERKDKVGGFTLRIKKIMAAPGLDCRKALVSTGCCLVRHGDLVC